MLIKQIIEFKLRGLGPTDSTCSPKLVVFMSKQKKYLKENLRMDYYLLLKYCRRQCILFPLPEPNHVQNLTPKG